MKQLKLNTFVILFLFIAALDTGLNFAQSKNITQFQYINPLPNSNYAPVKSTIIIRKGPAINENSIKSNLIYVYGSTSGQHKGQFKLSTDLKTLIFKPDEPFATNENVTIKLSQGLMTQSRINIGSLIFEFHTSNNINTLHPDEEGNYKVNSDSIQFKINKKLANSMLAGLPTLIVNKINNPAPGYLFLGLKPYLIIVDNQGTPIFYRNINGGMYDFKLQPNGVLTYFLYPKAYYELDSSYNIIHQYTASDGYTTNEHELRILPNGYYYLFGRRNVTMDMSKIVSGGNPNATIIDGALQEFDSTGNLIFEWDALAHYKITDVDNHVNLTQSTIDFAHFNAVDFDTDGNPLISARNLDEITKVNKNTGDIIWRWGGKNNQFKFINDTLGFSRQHDIRLFSNGNFSIFDNGVYHSIPVTSAVEYKLDEADKTATLVSRYYHSPEIFAQDEGSVQELPNGDRLISWGPVYAPAITEIHSDNSVAYELSYGSFQNKYRAFRFQWETNLFSTNKDSINFGKISDTDSSMQELTIYNPQDSSLVFNQFYCEDSSFVVLNSVPLTIPNKDSAKINIKFKPKQRGIFSDKLNIRIIQSNEMIARQVMLKGRTISLINPITTPTNLTAYSVGSDSVRLTWKDNSDNETGFVIERKQGDSLSTNTFDVLDTVASNDTVYFDRTVQDSITYTYRIFAINNDTLSGFSNITSIEVITAIKKLAELPKEFMLYQNYPNPFNPTTVIQYQIPHTAFVTLKVYNILGKVVATLVNEKESPGTYSVDFNAMNLGNGVYFYQLKADNFISAKKMVLLK